MQSGKGNQEIEYKNEQNEIYGITIFRLSLFYVNIDAITIEEYHKKSQDEDKAGQSSCMLIRLSVDQVPRIGNQKKFKHKQRPVDKGFKRWLQRSGHSDLSITIIIMMSRIRVEKEIYCHRGCDQQHTQ